ncbi:AlpA family transcriptional regulator [Rhodovulum bhavnagarense]|uniref:AlpA family transcriptional regulator n=2 Tax=Rhodovulum bhavnagarense TaxID=992286 RepID=A0A4R2RBE5_9RHOB|nr:helix-turn-helix domain-containing protein [Rhodovulum bhavnagarense]TCP60650.1 AlpA family transcriptional regulator [Rhodovulum bhavnagarense]
MQTDILTIKEVSAYLKITEKTAYRLTAEGKIPGFKVGGAWRFRKQEIDAWIDERMKDSGASS